MIALQRVGGPVVEPVTASNVKLYTRVSGATEDALITTWIKSAREKAELYLRQSFITQSWCLTLNAFPSDTESIYLPRGPLQDVISITYLDTNNTEVDMYTYGTTTSEGNIPIIVDTHSSTVRLAQDQEWPDLGTDVELNSVKITYQTGYGDAATDLPAFIADAIYVYCAYRYENRLGETDVIPRVFYHILESSDERHFCGLH